MRIFFVVFAAFAASLARAGAEGVYFSAAPKLAGKTVVFAAHKQYPSHHHNSETMFQKGEVNEARWKYCAGNSSLFIARFDSSGKLESLETPVFLKDGLVRDPSISYDARKIVFSMRKDADDSFNLYEYDLGTKKIRQLTFLKEASDINPVYLPSGEIVFSSTRASKYCACNRHIMCNLYKCGAGGENIAQIGNSIEFENGASVMSDGRILYTRWEYVDRNFSGAQGLWTCNPDGTRHALYWGQETNNAALDAVELSAGKVVAVIGSTHDKPWGALAVIDRNIDVEGKRSVVKIFPKEAIDLIDKPKDPYSDAMRALKVKYQYPSLVDSSTVAVSRQISEKDKALGLFLVDLNSGEETMVARAANGLGLFNFKVVEPRKVPPAIPAQCGVAGDKALVYVSNVYEGTHMKGVKKGDVKFLRIVEDTPKMMWSNGAWDAQGQQAPALNYHDFDNKIIYGVVPVAEDGSAYFEIPSGKFVYFQALDKDMQMLQSMRSGLSAMPSEIVSCAGCHESRKSPPPASLRASIALRGAPSKIKTFPHCGKLFSYAEQVQPIWDAHCLKCHDFGGKGSKKLVLAGDKGLVFNFSYFELHHKKYVNAIGAAGNAVVEANTWGAKHSAVVKKARSGHGGAKLSDAEIGTLKAWIDINAPYYPIDDAGAFADNPAGRSPLTAGECEKLWQLCGVEKMKQLSQKRKNPLIIPLRSYGEELVCFDRPEKSPALRGLDPSGENYKEALSLIKTGARRLAENPRPDMKGYKMSEKGKAFVGRFEKMCALELRAREAAQEGKKFPDPKNLE